MREMAIEGDVGAVSGPSAGARGTVPACALAVVAAAVTVPHGALTALAVLVLVGLAVAGAAWWIPRDHTSGPAVRRGWLLVGAGGVLAAVTSSFQLWSDASAPVAGDVPVLIGWLAALVGTLTLVSGRVGDRWIDALVEALLVGVPVAYLGIAFVLDDRPGSLSAVRGTMVVLAVAADLVLVVAAANLRAVQRHDRPWPATLVLLGALGLLATHSLRGWVALSAPPGTDLEAAWTVLAAVPALCWAAAARRPETRIVRDRLETLPTPLTRLRLAVVVVSIAVGPMVMAARITSGQSGGVAGITAGGVLVAGVAVAYLIRLVEQRARVEYLALHDDLVDLPNRVLLSDRIATALAQAPRQDAHVAVLFLDLDRFKNINDSLGHAAGNELLRAVAVRLTEHVRSGDTVARLAGDEFAVLLPALPDPTHGVLVAESVLAAFREPFDIAGRQLFVSASIGVSLHPDDAADAEELLRNADAAMYRAKANGRNTLQVYTGELNELAHRRLSLESYLHKAVERDELVLHYQPKIELRTGQIVGMEALLRWDHPDLGLLPPGDFIPMAEETGLIVPVGEWALEEACRQTRAWSDAGHPHLTVAVNLSPRQFQQQNVGDMVARVLRSSKLDPRALELELTESLALQDPDSITATLCDFKGMGVQTSIDDFGTGYSGLHYLTRFPIDRLKIDRFFVQEISQGGDNARIVAAVIALAHGLRLDVIAEGVETEEQLQFLLDYGCDEMQGYLFSRPVDAASFERLLTEPSAIAQLLPVEPRLHAVPEDALDPPVLHEPAVSVRLHHGAASP